jgi:uncharacterized protein
MNNISPVKVWRNQKKVRSLLGKTGKILTFTRVFVPPAGFISQAPYVVAIVEFDNGFKYTAQFVDSDEKQLKIGQKIIAVLRRTMDPGEEGVIPYGIKFKPI